MRNRIKYSQNFLRDNRLVKNLIRKSEISSNDIVYEIGAGEGIITQELLKRAKRVVAFELDRNFFNRLTQKFRDEENLELKAKDFLDCDLPNYPYKVFSNIPFNITSAIIKKLTSAINPPTNTYLIVQNEAAKKYAGRPIDNINSQIAVILNPFFEFLVIHRFKPNDFFPKPMVSIVLLEIKKRKKALIDSQYKEKYQDFVVYTFNQFKPNIREGLSKVFGSQKGLLPQLKPTELDFENWYILFSQFLRLPNNQQNIVSGSYATLLRQQQRLEKNHRTRVDINWKQKGGDK